MISTRSRFVAAVAGTLAGILALAGFGVYAMQGAVSDAEAVRADMRSLRAIAEIEDALRDLGEGPSGDAAAALDRRLERRLTSLRGAVGEPGVVALLGHLAQAVESARAAGTTDAWLAAQHLAGDLETAQIRASERTLGEESQDRAHRNSVLLLVIGTTVVAVFGAASAVVYARMRREQREAQERLRRSDRLAALGTIAASVAHEINNPLATISGCASAVRDRLRRADAGAHADSIEYLEMVEEETRRCTGIVKSLRDLAREGPSATTVDDLVRTARVVVALVEMDRKGKQVTYEIEGEPRVEAICDPDKVKQLLLNLLLNARDASEPGGRVVLRVTRSGAGVARLEVCDRGRGVPKKDLQRIFEPFHTDKTQGLGIGLFLCERIAAQHGGRIWAESDGTGKGARFVVEFPTRMGPERSEHLPAGAPAR